MRPGWLQVPIFNKNYKVYYISIIDTYLSITLLVVNTKYGMYFRPG